MSLDHYVNAAALIKEAYARFGDQLVLTSRCNPDSAFAIHLVTTHIPRIRVVYLIEEHTEAFSYVLEHHFGIPFERFSLEGDKLECFVHACRTLGAQAVVHGIRRYQTGNREGKESVEQGVDGLYRYHPALAFTAREVDDHIAMHDLPRLILPMEKEECGLHCFVPASS